MALALPKLMSFRKLLLWSALVTLFACLPHAIPERAGSRTLACIDSLGTVFPIHSQLFSQVQDEALKRSAMDYYLFLSGIELNALMDRQSIRSAYGLGVGLFPTGNLYAPPSVVNFSLSHNPFGATGALWGPTRLLSATQPSVISPASLVAGSLTSVRAGGLPQANPGPVRLSGPGISPQLGRANPPTVAIATGMAALPWSWR
jgi:hypothetical protein